MNRSRPCSDSSKTEGTHHGHRRPQFSASSPAFPPGSRLLSGPRHGPLPLLLLLTAVTGLVDAVSILRLGRVFVANMTGNVVLTGFALTGAPGFSSALRCSPSPGSCAAPPSAARWPPGPDTTGRCSCSAPPAASWPCSRRPRRGGLSHSLTAVPRDSLAALLAVAMGIQNAATRRLAVPDLTTTVLTMTLTGIAADLHARNHGPALLRRVLAVATMLAGAAAGALLVLRIGPAAALGLAAVLLALVTAGAMASARRPGTWRAGTP